jgi:hypothetical protein
MTHDVAVQTHRLTARKRISREEELRPQIIALRDQGMSIELICEQLHCATITCRRVLHGKWAKDERKQRLTERALTIASSKAMAAIERGVEDDPDLAMRLYEHIDPKVVQQPQAPSVNVNLPVMVIQGMESGKVNAFLRPRKQIAETIDNAEPAPEPQKDN